MADTNEALSILEGFINSRVSDGSCSPEYAEELRREVLEIETEIVSLREQVRALTAAFKVEAPDTAEVVISELTEIVGTPVGITMVKHAGRMEARAREAEAQVRALTADNAAQRDALLGIEHAGGNGTHCVECGIDKPGHEDSCSVGHALRGAFSPGAALLAETGALRQQVATLTAERDGSHEALAEAGRHADALLVRMEELEGKGRDAEAANDEARAEWSRCIDLATSFESERDALRLTVQRVEESRLTAMQRVRALEDALAKGDTLLAAECAGEVRALERLLTGIATPEEG